MMKRTDGNSCIGGDVLYLTASKIVTSLINLGTSMLLARFRTLDEYGTYSQIIIVVDLVSTVFLLGLPNSVNYFLAKAQSESQKRHFMSIYITVSTVLTGTMGLCLFCALPLIIRYFNNPAIAGFAYVFAVYPWSTLMDNSLSNLCIVYRKANRLIIYRLIHAVTTLLLLIAAQIIGLSFAQYMLLYMLSMLSFALYALGWMNRLVQGIRPLLEIRLIKEIFAFSIPMGLASVVGTLNAELDKLIIGRFFTTEEYAIFANAARELPITILATSLTAVLLPQLVRLLRDGKSKEAAAMWICAANISFWFMCLFVGGFIVFAPDIMSLLYSEKYVTAEGVAVFRIYATILLFRSLYWGIFLNATGKTRFILYSAVITLLSNVVGNIILCYALGFIGPAVSSLIVTSVMAAVQLIFSCRIIHVRFSDIMPWGSIAKYIAQTMLLAGVFAALKSNVIVTGDRMTSIAVSIGMGGVWAILYGIINKKELLQNWKGLNAPDL